MEWRASGVRGKLTGEMCGVVVGLVGADIPEKEEEWEAWDRG